LQKKENKKVEGLNQNIDVTTFNQYRQFTTYYSDLIGINKHIPWHKCTNPMNKQHKVNKIPSKKGKTRANLRKLKYTTGQAYSKNYL
jgi:hypothetical protein